MVRRARKSHVSNEENTKSSKGKLKPPYGSAGHNPFVVYCDLQRDSYPYARVLILNFAAEYAARYFIDLLIHNDTWEECEPVGTREGINTATGVRITMFGKTLWELLDYKMTAEEKEWADEEVKQQVLRFKYGTHEATRGRNDNEEELDGTDETLGDNTTKRRPKRKEPRAPKTAKVKVDKSGYVSANDIAKELKVEGREVRGALRASGMKKPDVGWMWEKKSDELKEARKVIEKNLKTKAKKK